MLAFRGRFRKLIASHLSEPISSLRSQQPTLCSLRRFSSMDDTETKNQGNAQQSAIPEPIPNRPLRGEKPFSNVDRRNTGLPNRGSRTPFNNATDNAESKEEIASPLEFLNRSADRRNDDATFLEKFKLGPGKTEKKRALRDGNEGDEAKVNCEQAAPEELPPDANEIFKKMKETGLIPNAVAMLDGLCKDGLVQEAMKLFGLMREKGTIPEVVIYTAVVEGFCKAQKLDDAKRIFRKMQSNGIAPNAFSYGVLIQGLYKCKRLEDAVEFTVEMLESGHSPNVTTFVGLVDGICKESSVEEAQNVIARLRQKGFFLNEKAVREFMEKKAPFSSSAWEAIFGRKTPKQPF